MIEGGLLMDKQGLNLARKKFLTDKKRITLEDCRDYVAEFYEEDKVWFYNLCMDEITDVNGTKRLRHFPEIKKQFYERYFKEEDTLTKRQLLFVDWDLSEKSDK